jgi:hypothetical protein
MCVIPKNESLKIHTSYKQKEYLDGAATIPRNKGLEMQIKLNTT